MFTDQAQKVTRPEAFDVWVNRAQQTNRTVKPDAGNGFQKPLWLIRLTNYEYWPFWLFYLPMLPVWLWQSIRNRSFTWFTATNQNIEFGGFFGESKIDILDQIPQKYRTASFFIPNEWTSVDLELFLETSKLSFPVVAKPNVGERGNDVEKIDSLNRLIAYHQSADGEYIIQPFIEEPVELGVFFVRLPGEEKGKVTSVTGKEFMEITGDGKSTIGGLMQKETRFRFQLDSMAKKLGKKMDTIPLKGEKVLLEPIGNHCRGTRFVNRNELLNPQLDVVFNRITKDMEGFYFGRFDLKVRSVEDLYIGQHIYILELNGASSEPGHIYDQKTGLLQAYRDLIWHWNALGEIAKRNQKAGIKPASTKQIIELLKGHFSSKS